MNYKKYLKIDIFHENNREDVFELFHRVHGKKMTNQFWDWRFNDNKDGSIRYLMWNDDKLIGNYVLHPISIKIGNTIEKVLFSMDTFTHPEYRGKGVFVKLANFSYKKAAELGYRLIIGFPNKNSNKIFFEKLGWKNLGQIIEYNKKIMGKSQTPDKVRCRITKLSKLDYRINKIWKTYEHERRFLVARTKDYLNWRFFQHPKQKFLNQPETEYFFFLIEDNNDQAYFILKNHANEKGHIVEYFGMLNQRMIQAIISYAISFCVENKLKSLSFWPNSMFNNKKEMAKIAAEYGFGLNITETYFGIKTLDDRIDNSIYDKNQWFINMGDSDVY